jgi:hypothetical protein
MDDSNARRAEQLVKRITPILTGEGPEVQSATLADLTSMLIAGHAPQLREQILALHIDLIRQLVPVNEKIMFGDLGFPTHMQ